MTTGPKARLCSIGGHENNGPSKLVSSVPAFSDARDSHSPMGVPQATFSVVEIRNLAKAGGES